MNGFATIIRNLLSILVLMPLISTESLAQDRSATEFEAQSEASGSGESSEPDIDKAFGRIRPREDKVKPLRPVPKALQTLLDSAISLNPVNTVFLDKPGGRMLLRTQVACDNCPLEMVCCLEDTKEHESILWLRAKAHTVKTGLMALGLKNGKPAQFYPDFRAPSGPAVDMFLNWVDEHGKLQRKNIQSLIRHSVSHYFSEKLAEPPKGMKIPYLELRYDPYNKELLWYGQMTKEQHDDLLTKCNDPRYQEIIRRFYKVTQPKGMDAEFVYTGSFFAKRRDSDEEVFAAEAGALICVANFVEALIDVAEASSANDGGRSYEAWPGRVPGTDTVVVLEIVPRKQQPDHQNPKSGQPETDQPSR